MTYVTIVECIPKKWFKPVSFLIRAYHAIFGNAKMSDGSHFALMIESCSGDIVVLEASSKTVRLVGTIDFLDRYDIVRSKTISISYTSKDIAAWYEGLLGTAYGYLQYIGILIKSPRFGMGIICNELVLRFISRFTTVNVDKIDIKDLNDTREIISNL